MAAGAFLGGGLSGYVGQASKMKKEGQSGMLRKKKKPPVAPAQQIKLPEGAKLDMPRSYKRGGRVKKTGMAKLHRGERVLTKKQAKRMRKR